MLPSKVPTVRVGTLLMQLEIVCYSIGAPL
jgi:hypothetical protein